jgi:hypothetical protein
VTTIATLCVADDPDAWRSAGFTVADDLSLRLGTVLVELGHDGQGIVGWVLAGAPDEGVTDVDGLTTAHGEPDDAAPCDHRLAVRRIDHVVVMTPDVDRTAGAVTRALGVPLKRVRDGVSLGRPVRQAFFRLGEVILELAGPPEPGIGPARFWGLALVLEDLDAAYTAAGPERMSEPKPAVQPGRRIASLRGLGLPVAVMDDAAR